MMSNPATVASSPARDLGIRAWVWLSMHRKTSYTLIFLAVCTLSQLILAAPAWANSPFGLDSRNITDSHDVPLWRYVDLPFDEGGVTEPVRAGRYIIASFLWMIYSFMMIAVAVVADWILSFAWLDWIAAPVVLLSETLGYFLGRMGIITLGILVSCVIIAFGFLRGRTGTSFVEAGIVVLMAGLVATDVANPIEWIAGDDGWIQTTTDYGAEAGVAMTDEDEDPEEVGGDSGSIVSGSIIDITLRNPMLTMSWGPIMQESGVCQDTWNELAGESDESADDIREVVNGCDDSTEAHNETSSFAWVGVLILGAIASGGINFMLVVLIIFLIKEVVMALLGAINTLIKGYFALFPGGARYAFFNALLQTVVSVVMIGIYIWAMIAYLWLVEQIADAAPNALGIGAMVMGVIIIILAATFFMMKKQGKKVGQSIARALGRGGLSGTDVPPRQGPSKLGQATSHMGNALDRARHRSKMTKAVTGMGMTASAAATGGASAGLAAAGKTAATTAGKSAAGKAGRAAASKAAGGATGKKPTMVPGKGGAIAPPSQRPRGEITGRGKTLTSTAPPVSAAPPAGRGGSLPAGTTGAQTKSLPAGGGSTGDLPEGGSGHAGALDSTQDRSMRPDELSNEPVRHSDRTEAATAAQGSRGVPSGVPAGAAGPTSESGGQQPEKHQSGSRRSSLPAGRYGNVFVHRDGSSTTVLKGEAENVPSNERLGKVMSIASPEVPTARSQRTGAGARTGGDVQRGSRPRAGGSTGQTPPTPPQTPEQGQPQRPGPRRSSSVGSQSQASRTQARHAEERLRRAEQTRQTATQQNSRAAEKGNQQRGSTSPAPASPSRPQAQSPRPPRSQPSKQVPKGAAPQEPKPQKSTKPQQSRVEQAAEKHRGSDR